MLDNAPLENDGEPREPGNCTRSRRAIVISEFFFQAVPHCVKAARSAINRTLFTRTAKIKRGSPRGVDGRGGEEKKLAMQSRSRDKQSSDALFSARFFFLASFSLHRDISPRNISAERRRSARVRVKIETECVHARAGAICVTQKRMLEIWHATRESRARVSAAL